MKSSRRKFTQALAMGTVAAPLLPTAAAQPTGDSIDLSLQVIHVNMNDDRARQIREALQNTARQVAAVRAYRLKRDTPPAVGLGVFDV